MGIYILFALLLLPAAHTQIYRRNIFDRILRNGYCDTVKQQPRWLFGAANLGQLRASITEPGLPPVSPGTEVSFVCASERPSLEIRCAEGFALRDGSQSKEVFSLAGIYPFFENCTEIICGSTTIHGANVTTFDESNFGTTLAVECNAALMIKNGDTSYTAECLGNGEWSRTDSCLVDINTGYILVPSTGLYYKYVNPGTRPRSSTIGAIETVCTDENPNAEVASQINLDVMRLVNATNDAMWDGGWIGASRANLASPWLWKDGSEITEFNWCALRPEFATDTPSPPAPTGPWCIYVNSCWSDFPCRWDREAVFCQYDPSSL